MEQGPHPHIPIPCTLNWIMMKTGHPPACFLCVRLSMFESNKAINKYSDVKNWRLVYPLWSLSVQACLYCTIIFCYSYFAWSHSLRTSYSGQPSQPEPSVLGSELEKPARDSFKWEGESRDDLGGVKKMCVLHHGC